MILFGASYSVEIKQTQHCVSGRACEAVWIGWGDIQPDITRARYWHPKQKKKREISGACIGNIAALFLATSSPSTTTATATTSTTTIPLKSQRADIK